MAAEHREAAYDTRILPIYCGTPGTMWGMDAQELTPQWPTREPGTLGFGYSMLGNLAIAGVFFGIGVLAYGYGDLYGLTDHPGLLFIAPGIALALSVVAGLVLLARPATRRFGAGVVGGALFAGVMEFVGLGLYFVSVVGS